jgi:hypothetical protein
VLHLLLLLAIDNERQIRHSALLQLGLLGSTLARYDDAAETDDAAIATTATLDFASLSVVARAAASSAATRSGD